MVIHFVKEIVSSLDADDRPDSFRVNYKDCYNIIPYTKQDITELIGINQIYNPKII